MDNDEKIQRVITRIQCGAGVKAACKAEELAPVTLYRSTAWKEYKMREEENTPSDLDIDPVHPCIVITRLPVSDDSRDPLFLVETYYAGEQTVGKHYFTTIQALVAQLPQLAFGLTP